MRGPAPPQAACSPSPRSRTWGSCSAASRCSARPGSPGVAVFVVGDGLVKAALFVSVGALEHRRGSVDEVALYGRGRDLKALGIVFAVTGLALAALPPFGPFLGRAMIEDAATKQGFGWISPILVVASALVGGAVLRVVRTVFLGRGAVPPRHPACREADAEESSLERGRAPWATIATGPRCSSWGWHGASCPGCRTLRPTQPRASPTTPATRRACCAAPRRARPRRRRRRRPPRRGSTASRRARSRSAVALLRTVPEGPLRALHSGRIGDYVAWTADRRGGDRLVFALTLA